jgi:hypothetical protein
MDTNLPEDGAVHEGHRPFVSNNLYKNFRDIQFIRIFTQVLKD